MFPFLFSVSSFHFHFQFPFPISSISCFSICPLFTAVFSQLTIFTADCLHHSIQMAGIETIRELHTRTVINSWLYSTRTYDVSRHLVATTNRWMHTRHVHLTAPQHCQKTSHRIQTTIVEKADAGTLGRRLGSLGFPCTRRQQPSERRLCSRV